MVPTVTNTRGRAKRRTFSADEKAAYRQAKADERAALIADGVNALRSSEGWARWLAFAASFHQYSIDNQLLIQMQRPDARMVAGYRAWQGKGRQVRKGERSIQILRPNPVIVRDADGNPVLDEDGKPQKRMTFAAAAVFDIAQTDPIEGMEQVDLTLITGIAGELTDDLEALRARVVAVLADDGWPVRFESVEGGAHGVTHYHEVRYWTAEGGDETYERLIRVDNRNSPAQQLKTLLHEAAHAYLHSGQDREGMTREQVELEAESVAHIVAGAYGLDTSAYTFGYLANWGADDETLKATAKRVRDCAHKLIEKIEGDR